MMIAEIAIASGFDSIATYYRVFRAHQGDFRDATISRTVYMRGRCPSLPESSATLRAWSGGRSGHLTVK